MFRLAWVKFYVFMRSTALLFLYLCLLLCPFLCPFLYPFLCPWNYLSVLNNLKINWWIIFAKDLLELSQYCENNREGFRKIVKKVEFPDHLTWRNLISSKKTRTTPTRTVTLMNEMQVSLTSRPWFFNFFIFFYFIDIYFAILIVAAVIAVLFLIQEVQRLIGDCEQIVGRDKLKEVIIYLNTNTYKSNKLLQFLKSWFLLL